MFEEPNRSFQHRQQPQTLPLTSPPPYTPRDQRASISIPPNDDYRCTITHQPPDTTVVHISIHIHSHLDTDRIPRWRVRRKLIALDQPLCAHCCTSDPAFFPRRKAPHEHAMHFVRVQRVSAVFWEVGGEEQDVAV